MSLLRPFSSKSRTSFRVRREQEVGTLRLASFLGVPSVLCPGCAGHTGKGPAGGVGGDGAAPGRVARHHLGGRAQPCFPGPSLGLATSLHWPDAGHQLPGSHTPEGASWEWNLILSNLCSLVVLRARAVRGPGGACHQDTAEGLTMFSSRPLPPSPAPAPLPRDTPDTGPPGRLGLRGVWEVLPPV